MPSASSTAHHPPRTPRRTPPNRPRSRAPLWRALASFAVIGLALLAAVSLTPRLGLDLEGGTQIVLETRDSERAKATRASTDRALEVLRGRVDALGVAEPTLARAGERRIIVELPGVQDPREAARVIGRTAQLGFHVVTDTTRAPARAVEGAPAEDEDGRPLTVGPLVLDGNGVSDARAELPQEGSASWVVSVDFNRSGAPEWRDLVQQACTTPGGGQRIAIVLDSEVISSPAAQPTLCQGAGGATQITGQFTQQTAQDLAILIKGGALPVPVEVIEQRTVGATLGDAAIDASIEAGIIGIALTGLFVVLVYRLMGLMATFALAAYALVSYGLLVWLGATLTLPGLAGFVLAIGLAIDANVLVFERAREEYAARRADGLAPATDTGYRKAWSAILDSNVTTLLAAGLLFFFASGPVKGFGITLSIGVIASMVSALVIARVLTDWAVRRSFTTGRVSGLGGTGRLRSWLTERGPFLMRRVGAWIAVTVVAGVVAVTGVATRGLDLGVEFTGGRIVEYSTSRDVSVEQARAAVTEAGFPQAVVQTSSGTGGRENITVRTGQISDDESVSIRDTLSREIGTVTQERDELIGPTLGSELRSKALIAFAIAVAAQMAYLAFRFRWTYAAAAVLSMASVVLTVVGVFAWWGKPVDGVFLAAVLSIIGLAVNDTIVVFDRIREGVRAPGSTVEAGGLRRTVNDAILTTVPRTVNTGIGAMLILATLAVLGGDSLQDFAVALLLGLSVGIYSTMFTAAPLAIWAEERWPATGSRRRPGAVDPYAAVPVGGRDSGSL
ncbi:MAG: protein translocase subunit SecD [Marmoricola sp.]|nr:protein translocase subunit SecD [Marmoricola sp.]